MSSAQADDPTGGAPSLRRRWLDGEISVGAFLDLGSPVAAEIVAGAGYDHVVIDLEHGYGGRGSTVAQLQAVGSTGTPALVRVPSARSDLIGWTLDMGAAGIVVPRIDTAAEARAAEAATRYGATRGAAPMARGGRYGHDLTYRSRADEERIVVIQIETAGALAAAEEIAALDGVDVLFVGPADLARCLRVDGGPDHPELMRAADAVARAARAAGKAAGVYLDSPELIGAYRDLGFTIVASGFDASLLAQAAGSRAASALAAMRGA